MTFCSTGQGAKTCAKMIWTIWVPIPRIYVKRNHRKLLAGLLQFPPLPPALLFLTPTSRGQRSRNSLAPHKERHKTNQHPKDLMSWAWSQANDSQTSGLSTIYCSSAHIQISTPSFTPLNWLHCLHRESWRARNTETNWNSWTHKAGFCEQVSVKASYGKEHFVRNKYLIHHNTNANNGIIIAVWSRQPQHPTDNLLWKHIRQVTQAELAINSGCVAPLECAQGAIDEES